MYTFEKFIAWKNFYVTDEISDLLLNVVIYKAFCLNVAEGRMNRVPNETWTHLWRLASQAC